MKIPQTARWSDSFFFFFLRNSSCSSLPLHTRKGLSSPSPTSPTRPRTIQVMAQHGQCTQSLWVLTAPVCLLLHPYSPPCDFKQPGLSQCCSNFVWQGSEPLMWLSPKSPAADPVRAGPGAAAALVPVLVPGTLLS